MTKQASHAATAAVEPVAFLDPHGQKQDPWPRLPRYSPTPTVNDLLAMRHGLEPPPPFFTFEDWHGDCSDLLAADLRELEALRDRAIAGVLAGPVQTSTTSAALPVAPLPANDASKKRKPRVRAPYRPTLPPDEVADARALRLVRSWGMAPRGKR